jgi:CDGSH-type Zn-finger protein
LTIRETQAPWSILIMADEVVIRCRENGPLVVSGPVKIIDHMGNAFTIAPGKPNVALCRCGQSKNKPFCDGSHKNCQFVAAELAPPPAPTPPPAPNP